MKSKEEIQYLVNLLLMAHADGSLDDRETEAIEKARKSIGARKTELNKARRIVQKGAGDFRFVGRFSDKIRNLEDMADICLADEKVDPCESKLLTQAAADLKLPHELLVLISDESKQRNALNKVEEGVICSKCNTNNLPEAKYCHHCGSPLSGEDHSTDSVRIDFDPPSSGVTIQFAESTSATFSNALHFAKTKGHNFHKVLIGKKFWFSVSWPKSEMVLAAELSQFMSSWRNRRVYLDGTPEEWYSVFGFVRCSERRKNAYKPEAYCFLGEDNCLNIWGCLISRFPWSSWERCFTFGRFSSFTEFEFDKDRIKHELEKNLHTVRCCPNFNRKYFEMVFHLFPEKAKVDGVFWDYRELFCERVPPPNAIEVERTIELEGFERTEKFFADGVKPIGYTVALTIMSTAMKHIGLPPVAINHDELY